MFTKIPVSILPARINHLIPMARIHHLAFHHDECVRLMYNGADCWAAVTRMLERRCPSPVYAMKVAMNEKLDRVIGWLCSGHVGYPRVPEGDGLAHLEWNVATAVEVDEVQSLLTRTSGDGEEDNVLRERRRELWNVISEKSELVQVTAMGCSRYLVINTVVTDPQSRGRGVASDLISMITEYADTEELSIFTQVPPSAVGVFQRAGFREIARLTLDMEHHSLSGSYVLRFMVRRPRRRSARKNAGKEWSTPERRKLPKG